MGFAVWRMRILVNDYGITKIYRLGDGFRVPWEAIEAWLVTSYPMTREQHERMWSKIYAGTSNEVRCSEDVPHQHHLFRVFDFGREPRFYILHGSLRDLCQLDPVLYRAVI
jgi:hypothetical protein